MVDRQHVLNDGAQLHFAPGAARFDVGHDALQVAHAGGQGFHFTQAVLHLLQPLTDQFEGFTQALLQRGVQFFVHRAAHFFELAGVVKLDGGQPLIECHPQLLGTLLAALHQPGELLRHRFLQGGKLVFDLKTVAFELVFERARHDAELRVDVGFERIKRLARAAGQGLKALLNAGLKQRGALRHGLAGLDALAGQAGQRRAQLSAETTQRLGQLFAPGGGIGLGLGQVRQQGFAGVFQAVGHGQLQGRQPLGKCRFEPTQTLLQLALKALKRHEQFSPAAARLGHSLGQLVVNGSANRFQAGGRGLRKALQVLPHAIERAVIFGYRLQGAAGRLLQGL